MSHAGRDRAAARHQRALLRQGVARVCGVTATIVPLLWAGTAVAQEAQELEEVIVTAQFRAERLQDTPIAITAVNADLLEQRSQSNIAQVAAQAPNVTLTPSQSSFGPGMGASIRGIGQYDLNPALEPGVGIYIDDVYYSQILGSNFDLLDVDRVEVLRGPQGTLAGKNSIGGAVKLFSKKPDGDTSGFVEATYGRFDRMEARAGANFAIIPERVFMRVSGVTREQDGFVDELDYGCDRPGNTAGVGGTNIPSTRAPGASCKVGEQGGKDYWGTRAALRFLPSDVLDINIAGDYTRDRSDTSPVTLISATSPLDAMTGAPLFPTYTTANFRPNDRYATYANFLDPAPFSVVAALAGQNPIGEPFTTPRDVKLTSWGVSGRVEWAISDELSLTSISAYRQFHTIFGDDQDASPLTIAQGLNDLKNRSKSQELRLNGTAFNNLLDYTVGGFYFDQTTTYKTRQDLRYVGLDFLGDDPVEATTKAGFVHGVWHLTDQLNLTTGYRYTKEEKDYHYSRIDPQTLTPAFLIGGLNGQVGSFSGSRSDYRVSVDYRWTPDFMTYVQWSTGFKGGGVNPRPFIETQVQPFGQETLNAAELGFKSAFLDRRAHLNGAIFYNKYKDIQLTMLSCPQFSPFPGFPCALPTNAGNATIKGLELEADYNVVAGLSIDASGSYLDFKYTSLDPAVRFNAFGQETGVTPDMITPFTPKWKFSAGVQYQWILGNAGSLTPRADASYQSSLYTNAVNAPTNKVDSYTVVNARLTWRSTDENWQSALEVLNVADKYYYVNNFDLSTLNGSVTGMPAPPRTWAVTIRRNFR